jgi:hypothetical protein
LRNLGGLRTILKNVRTKKYDSPLELEADFEKLHKVRGAARVQIFFHEDAGHVETWAQLQERIGSEEEAKLHVGNCASGHDR